MIFYFKQENYWMDNGCDCCPPDCYDNFVFLDCSDFTDIFDDTIEFNSEYDLTHHIFKKLFNSNIEYGEITVDKMNDEMLKDGFEIVIDYEYDGEDVNEL